MSKVLVVGLTDLTQKEIDNLTAQINQWMAEHGIFQYIGVEEVTFHQ